MIHLCHALTWCSLVDSPLRTIASLPCPLPAENGQRENLSNHEIMNNSATHCPITLKVGRLLHCVNGGSLRVVRINFR